MQAAAEAGPSLGRRAGWLWDSPAKSLQTGLAPTWEARGGPCRTPFRGRTVTRTGSLEAWEGDGLGQEGQPSNSPWGWGSQAAPAGRSRSAHDGLGVVGIAFFYFLEMPIGAIFSGRGFKYL